VHEVSLARALWRQVEAEMSRHAGRRLLAMDVAIGAFSGIEAESLEFALRLLARESDCPDAEVRIRTEPLTMVCTACGREFAPEGFQLACPACGSAETDPIAGTDLRLESLDVETDNAETHSPR